MKICLLGATGFLGRHIAEALVERGHDVRAVGRNTARLAQVPPGAEPFQADITRPDELAEALRGCDSVIHSVTAMTIAEAEAEPVRETLLNLLPVLHLIETCKAQGIGRVVFLSSGGAVYGEPAQVPTPEDAPLRPVNRYGVTMPSGQSLLTLEHW